MASNVIDRPAAAGEDQLNMKAYSEALTEFIANAQSPLTIALQGEWGSGKTSLMNALKKRLVGDNDDKNIIDKTTPFLGIWINTWQYALMSDPESAILKILTGIIGQISCVAKTTEEERRDLIKGLLRFGGGVASDIVKKGTGIDFKANIEEWSGKEAVNAKSDVESLKDKLAEAIKKALDNNKGKLGFIFFIDDLDRIDPPVAVQILELLKNIFDLEKCIFVLAIDYGVVVKGLKPKFGEMTTANEREFRSFFDKIIQLPFQMPVGSYQIDNFLIDSLRKIGFLDDTEKDNVGLNNSLTEYALESVGTNPRSLKRLINTLSLIRLLVSRTKTQEDDAAFKAGKDITFALVCLQIQYPQVYSALEKFPDFDKWDDRFAQSMQLPAISEDEIKKLGEMEEFDETWEQMLYRLCCKDPFLNARALNISRILNRIKESIVAGSDQGSQEDVGKKVQSLLRLSAVTSVKSEPEKIQVAEGFSKSEYLKDMRSHTLVMREVNVKGNRLWDASLPVGCCIYSWQKRVQSNFECSLWTGRNSIAEEKGDHITCPTFHINHDGKSFILKIWGEFWGNWPKDKFVGIDFSAKDIQPVLAAAEEAFRAAWNPFGVKANIGHHESNIWWNVTVPFKDKAELVSKEFSSKLRDSLANVAAAFATLLPYRVQTNNSK